MQVLNKPRKQHVSRQGRVAEYFTVDLDYSELLLLLRDPMTTSRMAKYLNVTANGIYLWKARKQFPLSAYKAIVVLQTKTDPKIVEVASAMELKLAVMKTRTPSQLTPEMVKLAERYDRLRAGAKLALAEGSGYYQIPAAVMAAPKEPDPTEILPVHTDASDTPYAPEVIAAEVAKPATTTLDASAPELETLLDVMTRVVVVKNELTLENSRLKQQLAEKQQTIHTMAEQNKQLRQSVKDWEELAGKDAFGTSAKLVAGPDVTDAIIDKLLTRLKGTGRSALAQELERINPKQVGRLHS
jgi:hypothetical protein